MTNATHGTIGFTTVPVEGSLDGPIPIGDSIQGSMQGWKASGRKPVCICDTQPVTAEGLRTLLSASADLEFLEATDSLARARELVQKLHPAALIIDKAFGIQAILDWLQEHRAWEAVSRPESVTGMVIWGTSITEAEALRFLQASAKGILRKTAAAPMIFSCLRTVGGRPQLDGGLRIPRFGTLGPLSSQ